MLVRLSFSLLVVAAALGQTPPPLRQSGAMRAVLIGSGGLDPFNLNDAAFQTTLAREFSVLEPGNAMKFGPIHPGVNTYNFGPADGLVSFAETNGLKVRAHTLVWHNQNPTWLTGSSYTPAQLSQILQDHIQTVVTHYAGKVIAWDVVNEAFNDDGTLRSTIWSDSPGIGLNGTAYIEQALRWARAADPTALLFYNDYSAETTNAKADAIYKMAQDFRARGVPLDGIGLQCHFTKTSTQGASMEANIKRLTDLGLQVHLTELDVRLPVDASGNASAADLQTQAQIYDTAVRACLKFPLCTLIQTWGLTDKFSWIPGAFPGFGAALPFDPAYQPKPAYTAIQNALATAAPVIASTGLVDAASYAGGGVAPGEIVVFFGPSFGPAALVTASVDAATYKLPVALAGARLTFDGVAAPLLYAAAGQVSGIVPFAVANQKSTQVQYQFNGVSSNVVTLPVVAVKPALFTLDASGRGAGAILDGATYQPITSQNPAARGSTVLIFLTGAGQTDPPGIDGQVSTGAPLPVPLGRVSVKIGDADATVLYAGGAVGLVHGGIQVNAVVPPAIGVGEQPVVVSVDGVPSQAGVTMSVK